MHRHASNPRLTRLLATMDRNRGPLSDLASFATATALPWLLVTLGQCAVRRLPPDMDTAVPVGPDSSSTSPE